MELSTDLLNLRELSLHDLDSIHNLHSLPKTDKYNTLGIPDSIEQTKQIISVWLDTKHELPRKQYIFCIESKSKELIGLIGMNIEKPSYKTSKSGINFIQKIGIQDLLLKP